MSKASHVPLAALAFLVLVLVVTAAPAQAQKCPACALAQERCTSICFGLETRAGMASCLMVCDNQAATCSCDDEKVTLRSEDLRIPSEWLASTTACNATYTCPSEYGSCASWSSWYDCGEPWCGIYRWCGDCGDEFGCWGDALRQRQERYRVCFNAAQEACTEFQHANYLVGCGC
jgi:hypothetical protein